MLNVRQANPRSIGILRDGKTSIFAKVRSNIYLVVYPGGLLGEVPQAGLLDHVYERLQQRGQRRHVPQVCHGAGDWTLPGHTQL